jgi:hypothetical protein
VGKNLGEKIFTQIKLRAIIGYITDNSPYFRQIIIITAPIPYKKKPSTIPKLKILIKPGFILITPSFQEICALAVTNVQKNIKAIAHDFVFIL